MANFSGFEITDESGRRQVSDTFYDATLTSFLPINGRVRLDGDFYALQPTSSIDTIHPALELDGEKGMVDGKGNVCFFDFAMTAQPTRFGIEVFDGSGKVTFSSNMIPLDVIDVIEHENVTDLRDSNGVYFRRKYASGVVPAVLPLRTPFWAIQGSHNYLADLATIGYCVQGSELIAKRDIALAQGWFPIPVEFYRGYKAIVIDVKRYSNIA